MRADQPSIRDAGPVAGGTRRTLKTKKQQLV
jgi:hypothetical protein